MTSNLNKITGVEKAIVVFERLSYFRNLAKAFVYFENEVGCKKSIPLSYYEYLNGWDELSNGDSREISNQELH